MFVDIPPSGSSHYCHSFQVSLLAFCGAKMRVLSLSLLCAQWLLSPVLGAGLATHDSTFVPDHVLRISAQDISQACDQRHSAVVNGTSPGPAIRIRPGGSSWIRVYNDMEDHNLTMVRDDQTTVQTYKAT